MTRHASLVLWLLLAVSACGVPEEEQINSNQPWFEDVADSAGVDFVHVRAKTSRYWLAEIMSGGAAWLDYDNDGDPDLFLTHLRAETNTLYQNEGGVFEDVTATTGLAAASVAFTGFGTGFADFDNDGHLDLYVGNGRVGRGLPVTSPFSEPNLLFRGLGGIRFKLVNPGGGTANQRIDNTRAVALADYDRDGGVDAVLVNNGGPARLLHNVAGAGRGWLALELRESNGREAIGALISPSAHIENTPRLCGLRRSCSQRVPLDA